MNLFQKSQHVQNKKTFPIPMKNVKNSKTHGSFGELWHFSTKDITRMVQIIR